VNEKKNLMPTCDHFLTDSNWLRSGNEFLQQIGEQMIHPTFLWSRIPDHFSFWLWHVLPLLLLGIPMQDELYPKPQWLFKIHDHTITLVLALLLGMDEHVPNVLILGKKH